MGPGCSNAPLTLPAECPWGDCAAHLAAPRLPTR